VVHDDNVLARVEHMFGLDMIQREGKFFVPQEAVYLRNRDDEGVSQKMTYTAQEEFNVGFRGQMF
jgi:hypothetical protein